MFCVCQCPFKLNNISHTFRKKSGAYYDVDTVLGAKDSKMNNTSTSPSSISLPRLRKLT